MKKETSALANELAVMKKKATRVNRFAKDLAVLPVESNLAPKEMRRAGGYVPRARKKNEALPMEHNTLWNPDTYRTGMGDTPQAVRPGAMDFMKCKSKGIG
jgi:hypothetical protein